MAEIDVVLSASLKRIASPSDAGVADVIRQRVAAGDPGAPAASSGFGGAAGGGNVALSVSGGNIPMFVGMILVAGAAGAGLGAAGVFAVPAPPTPDSPVTLSISRTVDALGCPGGSPAETLEPGQRLFATSRTADSRYLGVRDPYQLSRTLWLPASVLILDSGQASVDSLAVASCTTATPIPAVPPAQAPAPVPVPVPITGQPAADTSAPVIVDAQAVPSTIGSGYLAETSTITASARDNVGVDRIEATWPAVGFIGAGSRTIPGSSGSFTFGPIAWSGSNYADKVVPITFVAVDSSGNTSQPRVVNVTVHYVLG